MFKLLLQLHWHDYFLLQSSKMPAKKKRITLGKDKLKLFCGTQCQVISDETLTSDNKIFSFLRNILRHTNCEEGGIVFPSKKEEFQYRHYSVSTNKESYVTNENEGHGKRSLVGLCFSLDKPLIVNDFSKRLHYLNGRIIPENIRNFIAVPINLGQITLYLINKKGKEGFKTSTKHEIITLSKRLLPILFSSIMSFELQEEKEQIKSVRKFQEEMIHMVVHDLKGPLAEVIANLDILKNSARLNNDETNTLHYAEKGCTALWTMILDILDLAKLQENKLSLKKEKVNIVEFIDNLLDGLKQQLKGKGLSTWFDPQEDIPPIEVDKNVLIRVFNNLLLNAINYSQEEGKITITLEKMSAKRLKISINDQGRGIKAADIPFIFDKFNQSSEGGVKFSTGLGLTFCKLAIEAHRGEIFVESIVKKGSTFHVVLPIGASRLQLDGV